VKTAIIVLNYNGLALMQEFMAPLLRYSQQADIVVADNGSSDASLSWLDTHYPEVKAIALGKNLGYAGGYNRAIAQLNAHKSEQNDDPYQLYILLNNDIKVVQNWLTPIVAAFQNNPDLVAAQPKIKDLGDLQRFEYAGAAGGYIDAFGYPFCRGRIFNVLEQDHGQYDDQKDIFWASGACLALRAEAFERVDGFDEDLFAHQEEIDLCWRLKAQGGQVRCITDSSVYHKGGGTLKSAHPKKTFLNFRNSLLVLVKNMAGARILFIVLSRLILDGISGVVFLLQGRPKHTLAIIRAHMSFYRLLPNYLQKRKKWANRLKYAHISSILYARFFKNRRYFSQL
jgi:GT2 family glycosyltransferase